MRRLTELLSQPVISLYEGKTEGTIKNVVFNKNLKKLKWLILFDDKDLLEQKFLPAKDIFNIGENAVVIKNNATIVPTLSSLDEAKENNPINTSIYTVNGTLIDKVSDVILDEKNNTQFLELKNGTQISLEQIVVSGKDALILQDENNPISISSFKKKSFPKTSNADQTVRILEVKEETAQKPKPQKVSAKKEEAVKKVETTPAVEPTVEPVIEPTVEPVAEPAVESKKEPTPKPGPKPTPEVVEKEVVKEKEEPSPMLEPVEEKKEEVVKEETPKEPTPTKKPKATGKKKPATTKPKAKKEVTETTPEEEVPPQPNLEEESEKIEAELEYEKEALKEKKQILEKEINALKNSVKKLIKPRKKEEVKKEELSPPKIKTKPPVFSENSVRPTRILSNNSFLLKRIATKTIYTFNQEIILKAGEQVTRNHIDKAFVTGKLQELIKFTK